MLFYMTKGSKETEHIFMRHPLPHSPIWNQVHVLRQFIQ